MNRFRVPSFLLLFLAYCGVTSAQTVHQFETELDQAQELILSNPDSSLFIIDQVMIEAPPEAYSIRARAYLLEAQIHFYQANYDQATKEAEEGIDLLQNKDSAALLASLYKVYGSIKGAQGNYIQSLQEFYNALELYVKLGDEHSQYAVQNNIGITRLKLGDYQQALEIFLELDSKDHGYPQLDIAIPVNLASIYFNLGDIENAAIQADKALQIMSDSDLRKSGLYYITGNIRLEQGKLTEAQNFYQKSITGYNENNNELGKANPLVGLTKIYVKKQQFDAAETSALEALALAIKYNALPEKSAAYLILYQVAEARDDYKLAFKYLRKYDTYSDSLQNSKLQEQLGRLTAEYEFGKREADLMLLQREQQLETEAAFIRLRIIIISGVMIIILASLIIFILQRNARERKQVNKILEKRNQIIEEEAEKLNEANNIKNRLFSIIAHDLRGPLSSMQGVLSLIEINALSPKELERILPEVAEKFNSTSIMVTNLLQWARSQMEGFKAKPEIFDLAEIYAEKHRLLKARLSEKNLQLNYRPSPMPVYADRNMIDLVLQNLVSNAIKFSNCDDAITITTAEKGEFVEVSVCDNGLGIPEHKLSLLFGDDFYSTDGTNGERGTGLGLMLCKDFVEHNNGEIWVKSTFGEGTKVSFTIPGASQQDN